jgi:hypothetical protein
MWLVVLVSPRYMCVLRLVVYVSSTDINVGRRGEYVAPQYLNVGLILPRFGGLVDVSPARAPFST